MGAYWLQLRFISSGCPLLRAICATCTNSAIVDHNSRLNASVARLRDAQGAIVNGVPKTRVRQESERGDNGENGSSAKNPQQFTVEWRQGLVKRVRCDDAVRDPEDDKHHQCQRWPFQGFSSFVCVCFQRCQFTPRKTRRSAMWLPNSFALSLMGRRTGSSARAVLPGPRRSPSRWGACPARSPCPSSDDPYHRRWNPRGRPP
jgi:hypothetical protein